MSPKVQTLPAPTHEGSVAKRRVLIVENEPFLRCSLEELLEAQGYDVSTAGNGAEALRRLGAGSLPDVIMLDLKMPVMDGWEFRAIQKDDLRLRAIPVLVVSADTSAPAVAISAHGFLRKPFGAEAALAALEQVLSEDAQQRARSLSRLAATVGHEINNPLTVVMLHLRWALDELRLSTRVPAADPAPPADAEMRELRARVASVSELLEECEAGAIRIRDTVGDLQRLSQDVVGAGFGAGRPTDGVAVPLPPFNPSRDPSAPRAATPRGRILVIDDEPLIGRIIRSALEDDHDVVFLRRAAEALLRFEEGETFDVVLCDLVMPGVSGPAFHAEIAARWPHLVPHLVFMSGGACTSETVDFMERVAPTMLLKPFEMEELARLIQTALGARTAAERAPRARSGDRS